MTVRTAVVLVAAVLTLVLASPTAAQTGPAGGSDLYTIDLDTGALTFVSGIPGGAPVIGLAVLSLAQPTAYALTTTGTLVEFVPGDTTASQIVPITGLATGDSLVAIDFRPATLELYGLGANSNVYVIDETTGVATLVGDGFSPALSGTAFGFDFNPTVDRIRLDGNDGQNLRLNPDTGEVGTNPDTGAPTVDGDLSFAADDANAGAAPAIVAAGYTNNIDTADTTALYVIDADLDILALQDPPNDGVLNTVGPLGADATAVTAFDIGANGIAYVALAGVTLPETGTGPAVSDDAVPGGGAALVLAGATAAAGLAAAAAASQRRRAA